MKKVIILLLVSLATFFGFISCGANKASNVPHVLLITGGHSYDEVAFNKMLAQLPITFEHVKHPEAYPLLKKEQIARFDAILLYDMPKEIGEEPQKDFIAMLEDGKGVVVLHHAFCSYDFWPEYVKIIGGRYHHYSWKKKRVGNSRYQPTSMMLRLI